TINQSNDTAYSSVIGAPADLTNLTGPNLNNIALVKKGAGSLSLTGQNTYTGATTVDGGTLVVSGGLAGTTGVTVNNGATLAGEGSIILAAGGKVSIKSGATFAPGDINDLPTASIFVTDSGSPASNGTFELESGATLSIRLGATSAGGSQAIANEDLDNQLHVAGTVALAGTL